MASVITSGDSPLIVPPAINKCLSGPLRQQLDSADIMMLIPHGVGWKWVRVG